MVNEWWGIVNAWVAKPKDEVEILDRRSRISFMLAPWRECDGPPKRKGPKGFSPRAFGDDIYRKQFTYFFLSYFCMMFLDSSGGGEGAGVEPPHPTAAKPIPNSTTSATILIVSQTLIG